MMTDDITLKPGSAQTDQQGMQRGELEKTFQVEEQTAQAMEQKQLQAVPCPHCGAANDAEAMFCASCGKPLRMGVCPNCGSEIDPEADFCEVCHHYIRQDVCSFCGVHLSGQEAYCPECGNPRGGIVCPTCRTMNDFAFCKQCGTPLTEEARMLVAEMKKTPEYQQLAELANDYESLNMQLPYTSERDIVREQENNLLRQRVLLLLAQDRGVQNPVIPPKESKRLSKEELEARRAAVLDRMSELLDKMATPAMPQPAKVRNYAMASKPIGVRLAWVCNFKHAMHSSPCGCAKPQLGGKWVILGKGNKQEIKDDL